QCDGATRPGRDSIWFLGDSFPEIRHPVAGRYIPGLRCTRVGDKNEMLAHRVKRDALNVFRKPRGAERMLPRIHHVPDVKGIVAGVVSFPLHPCQKITIRAESKAENLSTGGGPSDRLHRQTGTGPTISITRLEAPNGYAPFILPTNRKILTVGVKGHCFDTTTKSAVSGFGQLLCRIDIPNPDGPIHIGRRQHASVGAKSEGFQTPVADVGQNLNNLACGCAAESNRVILALGGHPLAVWTKGDAPDVAGVPLTDEFFAAPGQEPGADGPARSGNQSVMVPAV